MKLVEKAKFIQAIITNENLQISASLASQMTECQEWIEELIRERSLPRLLLEEESDGQETV